jgi:hypothetical protein
VQSIEGVHPRMRNAVALLGREGKGHGWSPEAMMLIGNLVITQGVLLNDLHASYHLPLRSLNPTLEPRRATAPRILRKFSMLQPGPEPADRAPEQHALPATALDRHSRHHHRLVHHRQHGRRRVPREETPPLRIPVHRRGALRTMMMMMMMMMMARSLSLAVR